MTNASKMLDLVTMDPLKQRYHHRLICSQNENRFDISDFPKEMMTNKTYYSKKIKTMCYHSISALFISKVAKHARVGRFFVADKLRKKEVKINCFSVEKIVGHFSRKPRHGSLFKHRHDAIQVIKEEHVVIRKSGCERVLSKCDLWEDKKSDLELVYWKIKVTGVQWES